MQQVWKKVLQGKAYLTLVIGLLFLSNLFLGSVLIKDICIWGIVAVLCVSVFQIRGVSRIIGYVLFGIGIFLLIWHKAPLEIWMNGINRNIYMLIMFALTPLMSIPIAKGGYNKALQNFLGIFLERKVRFSMFIMTLSALVGVILNVATIPLMLTLGSQQKKEVDRQLLVTSIARGYALSVFWGPTFAAVALPLELTGARWIDYFPCSIVVSLFIMATYFIYLNYSEQKGMSAEEKQALKTNTGSLKDLDTDDRHKMVELAIWWVVILSFIVAFSVITGLNTINVVSITCIFFPILWMTVIRHLDVFKFEFTKNYLKKDLPNMNSEMVLFAGAGFIATAFDYSHAVDFIPGLLAVVTGGHTILFIICALAIITLTDVMGVHAMVPVVVLGSTINPLDYGLVPLSFSFILTAGWTLNIFLCGSSTVSILLSGFARKDPFTTSVGWNWRYGIYTFIVFCISAVLINFIYA